MSLLFVIDGKTKNNKTITKTEYAINSNTSLHKLYIHHLSLIDGGFENSNTKRKALTTTHKRYISPFFSFNSELTEK